VKDDDYDTDDTNDDSGGGCWAHPYVIVSPPLSETMSTTMESFNVALQMVYVAVHRYNGKLERRKGRKMGNIHLTAAHTEEALDINVPT
jgi:hypothetical protein